MNRTAQLQQPHTTALAPVFGTQSTAAIHGTSTDRCCAFEMFAARGLEPGRERADWLAAEHDVDARLFAEIAPVDFVG